jgi:DNA invertase Pin-like site-specific DNA recombinase
LTAPGSPKLNRLARTLLDTRDIADELADKGVVPSLGGSTYDPTDPVGRLLFHVLGMAAEFEADLIRTRTREGTAVAKATGRLKGTQPKLTKTQQKHLRKLHDEGKHTQAELADLFQVSRTTIHRELHAAPSEQPRQRAITEHRQRAAQSPQATP